MEDTEMEVTGVHNLRICHCAPYRNLWSSVVNVVVVVVEAQYYSKVHSSSYGSIPQDDNHSSVLSTVGGISRYIAFHCKD